MLLKILLISLAVSAILSNKTINRRRLDATCHRLIDDASCKNATEANTCTLFSDAYKSGTCEGNGYPVACKFRHGILYSSVVINYKDAASCKAAQDKVLHRRMAAIPCYRDSSDGSCKNAADAFTCQQFGFLMKGGTCEANGYPVVCKLGFMEVYNYKDAAACKAAQDKALHRRMADTCFYFADDKSYCKQADGTSCKTFSDSYKTGDCKSQSYPVECKLRYGMALWYKDAASCKAAQDKALHRRMAATCHMINDDGTCKNNTEASTCTTFADSYKSGTCEANGYSVACKLRYDIVLNCNRKN